MQALFELSKQDLPAKEKLDSILNKVEKESSPPLLARIHEKK